LELQQLKESKWNRLGGRGEEEEERNFSITFALDLVSVCECCTHVKQHYKI
jgi:hypothetical protein